MNIKSLKDVLDTIESRIKFMYLLAPAAVIIFLAEFLHLEQLKQLKTLIPHPKWLLTTINVLDQITVLWSMLGYALFFVSLIWWGIRTLLTRSLKLRDESHWGYSTLKGVVYILESSIWWSYLFCLKIVFQGQDNYTFLDNNHLQYLPLSLPVTMFSFIYVIRWLSKDTFGASIRLRAEELGLKQS